MKIALSNGQSITLDDFCKIVTLNAVRDFLREGFQHHLLSNPIMQSLLEFTPVEYEVSRGDSVEKKTKLKSIIEARRLCAAYKNSVTIV